MARDRSSRAHRHLDSAISQNHTARSRHEHHTHRSSNTSSRLSHAANHGISQSMTLPSAGSGLAAPTTYHTLPSSTGCQPPATTSQSCSTLPPASCVTEDLSVVSSYTAHQPSQFISLPSLANHLNTHISSVNRSAPSIPSASQGGDNPHLPNEMEQYERSSHGNEDINACTPHPGHGMNFNPSNHESHGDYHTLTIPDAVSGYAITELPRTINLASSPSQILMMNAQPPLTNSNNNDLHDCRVDQLQCYDQPPAMTNPVECLPQPFYYPPARRERTHQRRSRRRRRRSRHRSHRQYTSSNVNQDDRYVKPSCCSILGCKICMAACLQFKKVLVFFASFGVICVLIGIVLGVLRAPGNSFFTMSLMFVGLGLILLTMVLVGWKCTPTDHEPCHMLFGLGSYCRLTRRDRRRRERIYWLGSRLHPEFRYRVPPPSYAAAMQEYRNDLRDLESIPYMPGSPPPSYKSHTTVERPGIHIIFPRNDEFPNSNPPTYRLRTLTNRPSLAVLNDTHYPVSPEEPPNRFSVSSTAGLVESEQIIEPQTPLGIVNMSFDGSYQNLELSHHNLELSHHDLELSHHDLELSHHDLALSHHNLELSHHNLELSSQRFDISEQNFSSQNLELPHHDLELSHHDLEVAEPVVPPTETIDVESSDVTNQTTECTMITIENCDDSASTV